GKEREEFVFCNRPAQYGAKVVLPLRAFLARPVQKPVVRIQRGVAKVVEYGAMIRVGSRAGDEGNLSPRRASVFRRKAGRRDTELLQGIDRDEAVEAAKGGCVRQDADATLAERGAKAAAGICAHAIDHEVVCIGPLSVDGELSLLIDPPVGRAGDG